MMKHKTAYLGVIFLFCIPFYSIAQADVDSLVRMMERSKGAEKIRLLNALSDEYLRISPGKSIEFATQAFHLAEENQRRTDEALALNNLGKAYYFTGDYRRAENCYLESIAIYKDLNNRLELAKVYNNLGVLYRSQGNYEKALEYYGISLDIRRELDDLQGVSRSLNNIGEIHKFQANYAEAKIYYEQSYELKKQLNDRAGMANTLNNLGEIFNYWGEYEEALQYYQQSYTLYTELGDRSGMATSIFNIGGIYMELTSHEQALENFRQSLVLYEGMGEKQGMAYCLDNIGRVFLVREMYDSASLYFSRSLDIAEELGTKQGKASSLKNLGDVMHKMGETSGAIEYYKEALEIYEELGSQKGIADLFIRMGMSYLSRGQYRQAGNYFNRALALASEHNLRVILQEGYYGLSELHRKREKYQDALHYYIQATELRDSLTDEAVKKNINELEARYQSEKKEKELELKNAQLARQEVELRQRKLIQYGLIGGIFLLLALASAIYGSYRNKQHANLILSEQKSLIEQKNREITDSIRYAQHIQNAVLPHVDYAQQYFSEIFIYFKPKDIVSGDFYWMEKQDQYTYIAAVDATGHGVPGAFISLLGFNILNDTLKENEHPTAADILDGLNIGFSERMSKSNPKESIKDSMDIALCRINTAEMKMDYAGAYNPLWLIRDKEMIEIKADKFPIGHYLNQPRKKYTNHVIDIRSGDLIYLFSDGYADQFGGPEGKKFRYRKLRELFLANTHLTMQEQSVLLDRTMNEWMGGEEQVDDMLVIGIKI
ncbi:MAG TPA: tetratricopeptide repeat protein [Bacteroidetes bacterium]|nr:tetratricopeptide repeat protein [Bacteroidota bacterium]